MMTRDRKMCVLGAVIVVCLFAMPGCTTVSAEEADGKPPGFYKSKEAVRVAEMMLLAQRNTGGWSKGYDTRRKLTDADKKKLLSQKTQRDSTFDNGATHSEMRYLAKVYSATKDERYKNAFVRGVEFMLSAQFPNGGWPQTHPGGRGYHRDITFNDNAMTEVVALLKGITEDKRAFSFVDAKLRARCAKAVAKGIECILKCQIVVNGTKTAWCAQHEKRTLEPRGARTYELASISGFESIGVIKLLMSIDNPPPEIIDSIQCAVAWLDKSKLEGIKVVRREDKSAPRGFDQFVVKDPSAPPIWARFYDIQTNEPIFCRRDNRRVKTYAELSAERRTGYTWLYPFATEFLAKDYPAWQKKWAPGKSVLKKGNKK